MNTTVVLATSLALCAVAVSASRAEGQAAPCAIARSVIDSARADVASILFSDRPLLADLRKEQGISPTPAQVTVSPVRERTLCARLASQFNHILLPGTTFAVLRVGPIYYARDPDQRHGTGIFADSTFRVVMRLGAAIEK